LLPKEKKKKGYQLYDLTAQKKGEVQTYRPLTPKEIELTDFSVTLLEIFEMIEHP
jgi:hypothetical protein